MILTCPDCTIAEALERSVLSIGVCLHKFTEKCGQKAVEEEDRGNGDNDE